jgi:hypothetical protein
MTSVVLDEFNKYLCTFSACHCLGNYSDFAHIPYLSFITISIDKLLIKKLIILQLIFGKL